MKADSHLTVKLELNGSYFREYYYGDKPCKVFIHGPEAMIYCKSGEHAPNLEGK